MALFAQIFFAPVLSTMIALHPDLVEMENLDPDPEVWPVAVGGEDPRVHASAERGKKAIAINVERMTGLLREALSD